MTKSKTKPVCLHSVQSACDNLIAICDQMEEGDRVEMVIVRNDKTPEEIKALPDI